MTDTSWLQEVHTVFIYFHRFHNIHNVYSNPQHTHSLFSADITFFTDMLLFTENSQYPTSIIT